MLAVQNRRKEGNELTAIDSHWQPLTAIDNQWPISINKSLQTSSHQSAQKIWQPVRFRRGFTSMTAFGTFWCLHCFRMSISLSHLYHISITSPLNPVTSCPIFSSKLRLRRGCLPGALFDTHRFRCTKASKGIRLQGGKARAVYTGIQCSPRWKSPTFSLLHLWEHFRTS